MLWKNFLGQCRNQGMHSVGGNFPWTSYVSICFASRGTDCICFGLSFQVCLYSKQPWKRDIESLSRVEGRYVYCLLFSIIEITSLNKAKVMQSCMLTAHCKIFGLSKFKTSSPINPVFVQIPIWAHPCCSTGCLSKN